MAPTATRRALNAAAGGRYSPPVGGTRVAAIGVVAQPFADWQKAFWDNLATSMQLHHIPKVIAVNHRDCGAAKIAYGAEKVANAAVETETHKASLAAFRAAVAQRQPTLKVETALMALDGTVETFA